jgi:hypothetical protein
MLLSRHKKTGQNHDIKLEYRSLENVTHFGKVVANKHFNEKEIKRRLNSGNVYCHSVQKFLSSYLLSNNVRIRIYEHKTIILPVVLYGCKPWFL